MEQWPHQAESLHLAGGRLLPSSGRKAGTGHLCAHTQCITFTWGIVLQGTWP